MISLSRYATLLERSELRRTIVASVIGRLPIGILGLAILLATQAATGSFGHAVAVAACYLVGLAAMAPVLGRVVGQFTYILATVIEFGFFMSMLRYRQRFIIPREPIPAPPQ